MYVIESAGLTDVGQRRKNNEDALFLDDKQQLYVVADGMGGHQAGEVASGIVVETLWDYIKRFDDQTDVEELEDPDESLSKEANRLLSGIYLANKSVYQTAQGKEEYQGMGSTVSSVYFTANTLIAANVGDSPIYLVHDGAIEQLSVPHTVLAEQAALDPEGAQQLGGEFKHMLTRAMGVDETVKADISEIQCFRGDILVISSDGLTEYVRQGRNPRSGKKRATGKSVPHAGQHGQRKRGQGQYNRHSAESEKNSINVWRFFSLFFKTF